MANVPFDGAFAKAHHSFKQLLQDARRLEESTGTTLTSCELCLKVLQFIDSPAIQRVSIPVEPLINECTNHVPLFSSASTLTSQSLSLRKAARQRLIYIHPDFSRNDTTSMLEAPWEAVNPQRQQALFSAKAEQTQPRIVEHGWIDLELLRGWYDECKNSHAASCGSVEFDPAPASQPSLLIDTSLRCLVSGITSARYVALSYVWGETNAFTTTKATLELLSTPGALAQTGSTALKLPRTINEVIELTRALGETCLWIDAICIVQDREDRMYQLNAMASIYSNASLTIIAAQGSNANFGFRGLRDISQQRHARQRIAALLPEQYLFQSSSAQVWDNSLLEPWSTRAWAFQEQICSRRMLLFAHDTVRWHCKKARWSEECDSPDCTFTYATAAHRQLSLASPQLSPSGLPTLSEYEGLVNGFNCRKLTHPQDALSAFAGVATRLGRKFAGGLVSGLPELFFDLVLLWRPLMRLGPALRRHARATRSTNSHCLPSWSWAGWETEVVWPYTWNSNDDPAGPLPIFLGRIRPFYRIRQIFYTNQDGSKLPVAQSWFEHAVTGLDSHIPPGWSSHSAQTSETFAYGLMERTLLFTHNTDRSVGFCFPVPLSSTLTPPRTACFLGFRTTAGSCTLGETRRSMTRIHTLSGAPAGTLYQHDDTDLEYVKATSTEGLDYRPPIQLIAILGCVIPKEDSVVWDAVGLTSLSYAANNEPEVEPSRTEDIYNVMWIHWVDGVAYRKATGEIFRHVWEATAMDWVDVILG